MMPHLIAVALLLAQPASPPADTSPIPRPELGPADVVWIQLDALRENDRRGRDSGIAVVFRVASPANRQVTGPLDHFIQIVKGPAYLPMIGHRVAGAGRLVDGGDIAIQYMTLIAADGRVIEYEFRLSKDPKSGCWFNDGVVPVQAAKPTSPVI